MKLITRDTDYAIRALCFIAASRGKRVGSGQLAAALKVPRSFLRKILQILEHEGLVSSHKGAGGGFELLLPPDKIFLPDIMRAFQGEFFLNECLLRKHACPNIKSCRLKARIDSIEMYVARQLRGINVASLLR